MDTAWTLSLVNLNHETKYKSSHIAQHKGRSQKAQWGLCLYEKEIFLIKHFLAMFWEAVLFEDLCVASCERLYTFCYKQPVYQQLVFRWQIAKQLSGPKLLLLKSNKNYKLKKRIFICNKRLFVLNRQYTKFPLSQKHYCENFKITDHRYKF